MTHITLSYLIGFLLVLLLFGVIKADNQNLFVRVKTRKLSTTSNLPYDFYYLKFCKPKSLKNDVESLSEALFGDRIQNSIFNVCMK